MADINRYVDIALNKHPIVSSDIYENRAAVRALNKAVKEGVLQKTRKRIAGIGPWQDVWSRPGPPPTIIDA